MLNNYRKCDLIYSRCGFSSVELKTNEKKKRLFFRLFFFSLVTKHCEWMRVFLFWMWNTAADKVCTECRRKAVNKKCRLLCHYNPHEISINVSHDEICDTLTMFHSALRSAVVTTATVFLNIRTLASYTKHTNNWRGPEKKYGIENGKKWREKKRELQRTVQMSMYTNL